jgi:biopolymer transport protein ExbB/TolQ
MAFIEIFKEGGFIMYPLAIFSIMIIGVAIQKTIFLNKFGFEYSKFNEDALKFIKEGKIDELIMVNQKASKIIADPHDVLLSEEPFTKEEFDERLHRRLSETTQGLKSNLWILGTIGTSAPFVGLFGTVIGIMNAFKAIGAGGGKGGLAVVGPAISESLIATAAGIIVAVIAVMFFNYFNVQISLLNLDFKNKIEDLAEIMKMSKRKNNSHSEKKAA